MTQPSSFYNVITGMTENRIKELIQHAEDIDARELPVAETSSYFRAHAVTVYLAWCDITDGFRNVEDMERLEALTNQDTLAVGLSDF
ncbi:hypothetical protein KTQ42_20155 [Noviherbaspirillum sp. L7-7A]|uniref:hypothetical protein n=1 Tax=Noviherbaspirillum sp. L7-7A TaxID=2850560 RepID=UPI001C2B91DC|nr:hypothetical protein [Noviherbaspirillum sp. L7-7A]MBV0881597.1 hypothetical protein [Noviherbaspirillum sp. L7-7A]